MRPLVYVFAALMLAAASPASARTNAPPPTIAEGRQDVASIDAIIAALYDVISGEAGAPRDWARFHGLFLPGAMMGSAGRAADGAVRVRAFSPAEYVVLSSPLFERSPFYEREIGRRATRFGPVIQVMSAYETHDARDSAEPTQRGVNFITLLDDG